MSPGHALGQVRASPSALPEAYKIVIDTEDYKSVICAAMFRKHSRTHGSSTRFQSLSVCRSFVALAILLSFAAKQPSDAQTAEAGRITVTGEPVATPTPHDNFREMRQHIMPEVSGTEITVTKKATVIKLDQQPPVEDNNLQELFTKAPGFLITEQHTPGQFNFSYRGLGNPQESEFTLVLRDGLPLMSDWIGFPTLYYLPLPQSISEIQFIRGGNSLLYGPEPAPVVNFITKHPAPGSPWNVYTEQIGGAYGYYSNYNVIQEAVGPLEFRIDGGFVTADGQRITASTNCGKLISTWGIGLTSTNWLHSISTPVALTVVIREGSPISSG